jgi:hypothetical protein
MMIFIPTVHSVSLIPIYTLTLITLRSYSKAFWYTTFMVCPPGAKMKKDVLGFQLDSRQRIVDHVRTIETSLFQLLRY